MLLQKTAYLAAGQVQVTQNSRRHNITTLHLFTYLLIYSDTLTKSTELSTLSDNARKLAMKRSQKSRKSGRSIFFRPSLVLASTLTYSCVTGTRSLYKHAFHTIIQSHHLCQLTRFFSQFSFLKLLQVVPGFLKANLLH